MSDETEGAGALLAHGLDLMRRAEKAFEEANRRVLRAPRFAQERLDIYEAMLRQAQDHEWYLTKRLNAMEAEVIRLGGSVAVSIAAAVAQIEALDILMRSSGTSCLRRCWTRRTSTVGASFSSPASAR